MSKSIHDVIQSQYLAALGMLGETIERCPDDLWLADSPTNPFWRVAHHALFYTHFYLAEREEAFVRWPKQRTRSHELWNRGATLDPYTRAEVLEYVAYCCDEVKARVPPIDLSAPSGFSWLPFEKLELQLYSIRHVMHHAGELAERLGAQRGIEVGWIGTVPLSDGVR